MKHIKLLALDPTEFKDQLLQEFINRLTKLFPLLREELLTIEEAANLLKVSQATLWRWTKKGKLISYGIENRVYYKKSEVLSTLKKLS